MHTPHRRYETILLDTDAEGITWITFNRPDKRNAMNPQLHYDMTDALTICETDPATRLIVVTGAGSAWSAGQDLKEFFRGTDGDAEAQFRSFSAVKRWSWDLLANSRKPHIAMVNGYCFGGAWNALCNFDIVVAAEEATFGLPEVNWGIIPGGIVGKMVNELMPFRDALFYSMTGRTFDGRKAVELKLANLAVPLSQLREETLKLARELLEKDPVVLAYTKQCIRAVRTMDVPQAFEYLNAKLQALRFADRNRTRDRGIAEFIDNKSYKPAFEVVKDRPGER
ncbi:MAG TPA: p-hydroxycinnamoyl CoA hydratase/lyase [Ramlibacter sp.]|nr:p-hydroxycinnamoyl CoA hydratase/lyase [Ramlibacter sp.]